MSDSQNESRSTEVDEYYAKAGEKAKVGKKAKGSPKSVFNEKSVASEKSKAGNKAVKERSIWAWAFRVLAGFEVAIICLLMLFAATFFGTLEQTQVGLYQTLQKYFDMEALFVIPELNGKIIPLPIPGTFWVSAVLVVNMTLGGLIRARKGWKTAGVLIAHFSMIFLLVAGGVSQISKKEGVMHVYQGDRSDYARSYTEPTIEIYPIGDKGQRDRPFVVDSKHLTGLKSEDSLTVRLPEELPFDLKVSGFLRSSDLLQVGRAKDQHEGERVVDVFFLKETNRAQHEDTNLNGC